MDIRLYHKVSGQNSRFVFSVLIIITYKMIRLFWSQVKGMANPFAYEEYRKEKIRQKIDESRTQRVNIQVGDSGEKCLFFQLWCGVSKMHSFTLDCNLITKHLTKRGIEF